MWRVNSKGQFNVPIGSAEKPAICQPLVLRACHRSLQGVFLCLKSFNKVAPGEGDFIYFDPPYHPLAGGSFTDYARNGFGEAEQIMLRDLCRELHMRGASILLSNSDTPFTRGLYADCIFSIDEVRAPRMVNSKPDQRGAVSELLVTNYEVGSL